MIHYHGGPITPNDAARAAWRKRHAFVSFWRPDQIAIAAEVCQSFALDNGAFSAWRNKSEYDFAGYADFVSEWRSHPGFDWAVIPDVIDGSEEENDRLIEAWRSDVGEWYSVPVWHLHESLERLDRLVSGWPRVALGSSGEFSSPGSPRWWGRMHEAMQVACDEHGRARTKLHGLRMLASTITSHLPLASADSTNVARNFKRLPKGAFKRMSPEDEAKEKAYKIEAHATAHRYLGTRGVQENLELVG